MLIRSTAAVVLLASAWGGNAATPACTRTAGLAVDADGAPNSYLLDGNGLSYTCDGVFAVIKGVAHNQKNDKQNWQALCRSHWAEAQRTGDYSKVKIVGFMQDRSGRPVVQGAGDPLPGKAYVTTTTLTVPSTPPAAQRHYVDAVKIPYVVLPPTWARAHHVSLGDLVAVYRPKTDRLAFAVYADCCSLGEGSVRLHQDLGADPMVAGAGGIRRAKRGLGDTIVFKALPGTRITPTLDAQAWRRGIADLGSKKLATLGGITGLRSCAERAR